MTETKYIFPKQPQSMAVLEKYTGRTDGRILKGLRFKFPIYMNRRNVMGVDWDNESTDETVVRLKQNK